VQQSARGRSNLTSNTLRAVLIAVFLTALGACSSQVTVDAPTIPDPLVDRIPISVAVKFPDAFEHFVHQENVIGKEKWTIDLGRSNILLFTKLFDAMFEDFTVADDSVSRASTPSSFQSQVKAKRLPSQSGSGIASRSSTVGASSLRTGRSVPMARA
jgi:hypothetical protein